MEGDKKPGAIAQAVGYNDIVLVAEPDHTDENIARTVGMQLEEARTRNAKHLFLEHDPNQVSLDTLAGLDSEYGKMIRGAQAQGYQVHLYDDRSRQIERDARYPEEAKLRQETDVYLRDPEALVAKAVHPERMRAYLNENRDNASADLAYRNARMTEFIANEMDKHPGEKALAMIGGAHVSDLQDVDEGLRARGYRTMTAEVNSPETNSANLQNRLNAADKPDVIIAAETGDAVSFKQPGTNTMRAVQQLKEGEEIPWQNVEPVAPKHVANGNGAVSEGVPALESKSSANPDFAKLISGVDCSWAKGMPLESDKRQSAMPLESAPQTPAMPLESSKSNDGACR